MDISIGGEMNNESQDELTLLSAPLSNCTQLDVVEDTTGGEWSTVAAVAVGTFLCTLCAMESDVVVGVDGMFSFSIPIPFFSLSISFEALIVYLSNIFIVQLECVRVSSARDSRTIALSATFSSYQNITENHFE